MTTLTRSDNIVWCKFSKKTKHILICSVIVILPIHILIGIWFWSNILFLHNNRVKLDITGLSTSGFGADINEKYLNRTNSELEKTHYGNFEEDAEWGGGGLTGLSGKSIFGEDKPDEDPDGDRLTNAEEEKWGTNPHDPDTDGDKMIDGGEVELGTDPLDPNDGGASKQF